MPSTLYDKLETYKKCDSKELKKQFLRMAKKHHPHYSATGSEEVFSGIVQAYNILRNTKQRYFYDQFGEVGLSMITNEQTWELMTGIFNEFNMYIFGLFTAYLSTLFVTFPFLLLIKEFFVSRISYYTFGVHMLGACLLLLGIMFRTLCAFLPHISLFLNHIVLGVLIASKISLLCGQVVIGLLVKDKIIVLSRFLSLAPLYFCAIISILEDAATIVALKSHISFEIVAALIFKPVLIIGSGVVFIFEYNIYIKFVFFWLVMAAYLLLFGDPITRIVRIIAVFLGLTYLVGCFIFKKIEFSICIRISLLLPYICVFFCMWRVLIILENIKPRPKLSGPECIVEHVEVSNDEEKEILALANNVKYLPHYKPMSLALYKYHTKRFLEFQKQ